MALFQTGEYVLNSGKETDWKIECDDLVRGDWQTVAKLVQSVFPRFRAVYGIPHGGWPLEEQLRPLAVDDPKAPYLIVDDVLTTGGSMERARKRLFDQGERETWGVVLFARGKAPAWVIPLFQLRLEYAGF